MKKTGRITIIMILLALSALSLSAKPLEIKIGSPAPKGSPWDDALKKIAAEWKDISGGQVTVTIYPGGIAGNESDMLRKMRTNNLQAGVFTSLGVNQIYQDTLALSIPFLIQSDKEFDRVLEKVGPGLEADIEKSGFKVVAWTNVGWLHFFGKRPIITPDDLKRQKMAASDSDAAMAQAFKNLGFNTVPLSNNEVMPALSSGMVEACYAIPLAAAAYQWFGIANNMNGIPFSPVMGAIVLSDRAWKRVPENIRGELMASARGAALEMSKQVTKLESDAMKIMLANGLVVNPVPVGVKEQWEKEFSRGFEMIVGSTFSRDIYDRINQVLAEYRR